MKKGLSERLEKSILFSTHVTGLNAPLHPLTSSPHWFNLLGGSRAICGSLFILLFLYMLRSRILRETIRWRRENRSKREEVRGERKAQVRNGPGEGEMWDHWPTIHGTMATWLVFGPRECRGRRDRSGDSRHLVYGGEDREKKERERERFLLLVFVVIGRFAGRPPLYTCNTLYAKGFVVPSRERRCYARISFEF